MAENPDCFFHGVENRFHGVENPEKSETGGGQGQAMKHPRKRRREFAHAAEFRFYEELNDFLPAEKRGRTVIYRFDGHPGIKDAIEAQGCRTRWT